jgi:methionine-rich copper-binding protein CopC
MISRRHSILAGTSAGLLALVPVAHAQVTVLDSQPKANAVIGRRSSAFYVRFDGLVDHEDSRLAVMHDGKVVEVLHPRLESAPNVLFARAPTLQPGNYTLHWRVGGPTPQQGEIPFTVGKD